MIWSGEFWSVNRPSARSSAASSACRSYLTPCRFDSMQDQVFVIDKRGRFTEFFQPLGDN